MQPTALCAEMHAFMCAYTWLKICPPSIHSSRVTMIDHEHEIPQPDTGFLLTQERFLRYFNSGDP